jgi:uncharacterized RDD family membrane protein YckC
MSAPGGHAGVVTRSLAAAVDTAVVAVAMVIVYLGTAAVRFAFMPLAFIWPRPGPVFSVVGAAVVATAYLSAAWAITGRTYGGGLLGLRVLSARRGLIGWPRAILRAVACVVFPAGLLWAAVSPTRRSLQDLLLGSVVVYDWHRDRGTRAMAPEEVPR